jgi:uncharacterized membrane protein YtjA (UPF0391 family)
MLGTAIFCVLVVFSATVGFFGFTGVVAPIAKVALLLVPAIFTISLIVGFASRKRAWFR